MAARADRDPRRFARLAMALAVAMLSPAAAPAAAFAATLSIHVIPSTVKSGATYQVQITGSFNRRHGYLIAFLQYSPSACKRSATKELHRTHGTGGAYYSHRIGFKRFLLRTNFHAGAPGVRRVCAYLFPRRVKPGTRVRPIKQAGAPYRVIR